MAKKADLLKRLTRERRQMKEAGIAELPKVSSKYTVKDLQRVLKEIKPIVTEVLQRRQDIKIEKRKERIVDKFNTERERLLKAGAREEYLPRKLGDVSRYTEKELKDIASQLTPANVSTVEKITKTDYISIARKNVAEIERKIANRLKREDRERTSKIETTLRGESTGLTRGEMGDLRQSGMRDFGEFHAERGLASWEKHAKAIENYLDMNTPEVYKENYIKVLLTQFGSDAYNLIRSIELVDNQKFLDWYYQEEDVNIEYIYDASQNKEYLSGLENMFDKLGLNQDVEFDEGFDARQDQRLKDIGTANVKL